MSPGRWSLVIAAAVAAAQCMVAVLLHGVLVAEAQQLSIRRYDVRDGLAHSRLECIYQDAKGYLWFGTWEGLSRFDGYRFTNYGIRDGLENLIINDIVENRQGRLWVGTNAGVARLIDDPHEALSARHGEPTPTAWKRFVNYRVGDSTLSNSVGAMLIDANNTLWCVTNYGLYRAAAGSPQANELKFEVVVPMEPFLYGMVAFADSRGRLWFGMDKQLIEVVQGAIVQYDPPDEMSPDQIMSLVQDRRGRVLVAYGHAVFEFIEPTGAQSRGRWKRVSLALEPGQWIASMVSDATGVLWIGTNHGLIKYREGLQTVYTTAHSLSADFVSALLQDREGNLWIGTNGGGVCKLSGETIVSFTEAEGLPDQNVMQVIEDRQGHIYGSTADHGIVEIVDRKAMPIPGSQAPPYNRIHKRIIQDRQGYWWIGTDEGLFRFPGPKLQFRSGKKFTAADGFSAAGAWPLYEDPTGRVWVSSTSLSWFDSAGKRRPLFQHIALPTSSLSPPREMMSDRSGALWLAPLDGLGRLIKGNILVFQPTEGLPDTRARALFQDSRGWLWIGLRYNGVSMTKDPTAERPIFVNYSTQNGLASDTVWSIAEDDFGRIYLGTGRGLDQLDPTTGRIHHFTTAGGLAGDLINHCMRDSRGHIWVATTTGLSKLSPPADRAVSWPPPIYLSRVQVAGEDLLLPETGTRRMPELTLPATQNNLRIEYIGLSFQGEQALTYQYKLEGVDADWSPAGGQRSVNYARLGSGSYRVLVRAINQTGAASLEPAMLEFRILPPIWQRWWFLALVAIVLTAGGFALHRIGVRQVLAMERIRRQIATDLHDDIGSGLSQVAILSEVGKREAPPAVAELLNEVANLARSMRDSMSDIVWAVDPRKDRLADLVQRMRQASFNLLEAEGPHVEFRAPEDEEIERIGLAPDRRRHLLLIFKEALTNVARHAEAAQVYVEVELDASDLRLRIRDDGRGFDPQARYDGHGLQSLRQRAAELKADLTIESEPGHGTTIQVTVPLKKV
ncbi:MAG: ATP-binding protein [Acidobacteria bacterium]|nr:ATP-binding protein [Acidobacteriota bacterium]